MFRRLIQPFFVTLYFNCLTCPAVELTPAQEAQLSKVLEMLRVSVPIQAPWKRITKLRRPDPALTSKNYYVRGSTEPLQGFLLEEKADTFSLLDFYGEFYQLPKEAFRVEEYNFQTAVQDLESRKLTLPLDADEKARFRKMTEVSANLGHTDPFLSAYEVILAAWLFERKERVVSARLLEPIVQSKADDQMPYWIARYHLGHLYFQQMLEAFTNDRDYAKAIELGKHLLKPVFKGYQYQEVAAELVAQLAKRNEDFTKLALPTPEKWAELQKELSRADQISFLAERMRLLNCFQRTDPGGANYEQKQYATPATDAWFQKPRTEVINPFVTLSNLNLKPAELQILLPWLDRDEYMPTYSCFRSFYHERTLHRASWPISILINAVAKEDLITGESLVPANRPWLIKKLEEWIKSQP